MRRAFAALAAMDDIGVVICDSVDREVQQSLRDSAAAASAARRERIAVAAGGAGETVTELLGPGQGAEQRAGGAGGPGHRRGRGGRLRPLPGRSCGRGYCRDNRPRPPPGGRGAQRTVWAGDNLWGQRPGPAHPGRRDSGRADGWGDLGGAGSDHTHHYRPGRRTPPGESCPPSWWWTT